MIPRIAGVCPSLLAAVVTLAASPPAWACAVCQDPNDARAKAYFDMTIFLSLFPLLAMGIGGTWLYRRYTEPHPEPERT